MLGYNEVASSALQQGEVLLESLSYTSPSHY